jgi:hypothetical protein
VTCCTSGKLFLLENLKKVWLCGKQYTKARLTFSQFWIDECISTRRHVHATSNEWPFGKCIAIGSIIIDWEILSVFIKKETANIKTMKNKLDFKKLKIAFTIILQDNVNKHVDDNLMII